jgi:hypothetical protein
VTLSKGAGGKLAIRDVQGNVAGVVSGPVKIGKLSVYFIDKVLMSGECAGRLTYCSGVASFAAAASDQQPLYVSYKVLLSGACTDRIRCKILYSDGNVMR